MADSRFFHKAAALTLGEVARIGGCTLPANADASRLLTDVAALEAAQPGDVTFLDNRKYRDAFATTQASACIVAADNTVTPPDHLVLLKSADPYKSYARVAAAFYPEPLANGCIHPRAIVAASAHIGSGCQIDAGAVIGENVTLGDGCHVGANAVLGDSVQIGKHCRIGANASVEYALIGDHVVIYPGARIGQRGFGFAFDLEKPAKIPQLGRVIIGNHVEIGANTCVDRGAGPDTVISDNVMIDNLVQIAHNVQIGRGAIVVAQVGISGSTHIGAYAQLGGQAGLAGHLKVGQGAKIAAQAGVMRDVAAGETVAGSPSFPIKEHFRHISILQKLARRAKD